MTAFWCRRCREYTSIERITKTRDGDIVNDALHCGKCWQLITNWEHIKKDKREKAIGQRVRYALKEQPTEGVIIAKIEDDRLVIAWDDGYIDDVDGNIYDYDEINEI